MAIVSMQKLSICANRRRRKEILETIQALGAMEITTGDIQDEDLRKMDTQSARAQFEKSAESFDRALELLQQYAPESKKGISLFAERERVSRERVREIEKNRSACLQDVSRLLKNDREITEARGTILKDENQIKALQPWLKLDVPMNLAGTKTTALLIGTMPEQIGEAELAALAREGLPESSDVDAHVISSDRELTCVAVLSLKSDAERVSGNLRSRGFARPSFSGDVPERQSEALQKDIEQQKQRIADLEKEIASFQDKREEFRIAADYFRTRAEKYRILGTLPQTENVFFLEGWVLADQADRISRLLTEKYGAYVEREEIRDTASEPTVLKNNRFSETVEGVLESYGLPQHGHVDPTFVMSIFYVFFFGMMLSDAGYGIVMFIACAVILKKHPNLDTGLKKTLRMFFWCGISTTFWGFMYGGFFGNAIDTVATTFFGYHGDTILKPLWFEPLSDPMRLLVWCMLFGLIHLFAGLGIKGWEDLKNRDIVGFVSDVAAWYMFVLGLVLILLPTDIFASIAGQKFVFPAWVNTLAKILTFAGMGIILVMGGRGRKNWGIRIALGAYDIYGISSWLSDVLSYSRLLALGLATGVIANVINMMASMVGRSVPGAIVFIVVFILGHLLNLAINALGAYVHTNRLQFVEFFGKFYDGGGKAFRPFQAANKYIEIKEEKLL